jgi:nucleoside-diphosphate-sugar epimerase
MERILITGGAGFIGTHLAQRLIDEGSEITIFDNYRRNSLKSIPTLAENPAIKVVSGDVLDPPSIASAINGADTVIHLAAIAGVTSYYTESLRTLQVNILGTVNMLDAAVKAGVRTFIDFSTSEVFGSDAMWVTEETPHGIGPVSDRRWVYATSKLASEHLTLRYGEQYGFQAICVRPFNIYGPRQTGEGAIANFCTAALGGQPLLVYGDGSALRAWCYISDMVDAVMRILKTPEAAGQTFNIGNPSEVENTLGLARRIARMVPGAKIERKDVTRAEVRARIPDITKARRVLGFQPKVDLDEGLANLLAWYQESKAV